MDFLNDQVVDAAVQVQEEAFSLIHERFPEDSKDQVEEGSKTAFTALNLGGGIITAEAILAHYQQQRGAHSR